MGFRKAFAQSEKKGNYATALKLPEARELLAQQPDSFTKKLASRNSKFGRRFFTGILSKISLRV